MMNIQKAFALSIAAIVLAVSFSAHAALTPSFFLAQINNNTQTQVTVLGADPSAQVTLYYPQNGAYVSLNIGTTDSNGRLTTTVDPSARSVTSGGPAYVMVAGAQSQTQTWPAYSAASNSSAGLSLSSTNVSVVVGQSTAVTAGVTSGTVGSLSVQSNTNASVVSGSVSGSQIVVNGLSAGAASMTICATNSGCATLYVTVQQPSTVSGTTAAANTTVSFTPTSLSMRVAETRTVALSGSGSYYISAHSNPGIVATSISGSTLTVTGAIVGTDNMGVCSSGNNIVSCSNLSVTVAARDPSSSVSGSNATISFSPSNLNLSLGQTQTVTVTGSALGSYYVSNNSNSDIIGANLSGNSISVMGNKVGGANVTVCQLGGQCGSFYAYVAAGSGTTAAATSATQPLALSSFSVSSNNVNSKFLGSSVALTVVFSLNQGVTNPSATIGGVGVPVFGSGSGPYTAIYTMNGGEALPLVVDLTFGNATAGTGNARFSIGTSVAASSGGVSTPSSPASSATFTSYLESGSTGAQVTALQTRLKALGIYSGPITGTFGAQTEAAVKKYQAKNGLTQLGAVGPATRALLNQGN